MISLIDSLPAASPDPSAAVFNLISIVADPATAKVAPGKIADAKAAADAAIEAAAAAQVALDSARKEQAQTLKNERDLHDSSLAQSKSAFDADCARRIRELDARADAVTKLEAQAKADAAAAAELKAELQRRVDAIKAAVAA
jgi:hypothetical protein